jgi:hypothetical protein
MLQTCGKCSRANPAEAVYCHFDGAALNGHGRARGPVAIGAQPFPMPFVFPSGRNCRSFNELALACQDDWQGARNLLQQGVFHSFFGGMGRADLAVAAREAARYPDADRGLDDLLSRLPADSLEAPRLRVEPVEVNLGLIQAGEERNFELVLENQGMRLLCGTVNADAAWLTLEGGVNVKHFQCRHEHRLPVHVALDRLRASNKPIEARLTVESNGDTQTVVVRAERPVLLFPQGTLAGARSPRQVAEKARASPKAAVPLFESGAVADWYRSNGWTYPVQGPSASGLGAIQQFFEALGLTPPPKVEISVRSIQLQGNPGERLTCTVEVKTQEKRPVYAHGLGDRDWISVEGARLNGPTAVITLNVLVPDEPGETLTGHLTVQSNGNQRFVLPVALQISRRRPLPLPVVAEVVPEVETVLPVVEPVRPRPARTGRHEPGPMSDEERRGPARRRPRQRVRLPERPLWPMLVLVGILLVVLVAGAALVNFMRREAGRTEETAREVSALDALKANNYWTGEMIVDGQRMPVSLEVIDCDPSGATLTLRTGAGEAEVYSVAPGDRDKAITCEKPGRRFKTVLTFSAINRCAVERNILFDPGRGEKQTLYFDLKPAKKP